MQATALRVVLTVKKKAYQPLTEPMVRPATP